MRYALLERFTRQKRTILFNGEKIRLRSDPLLAGPGELQPAAIQPTGYFDTLVTNDAVRLSVTTRDGRTVLSGADYCFPAGVIPDCRRSRCANQFGTTALALTSDDYFVIAGQGTGNVIHPGKWTAPGSGSADWADTRGVTDLQDLIRAAAVRELAEETGLIPDGIEWIRVIGYGRLLERGGLPQFFFLARLRRSLADLRITRSERSLVDYHAQLHFGPRPREQLAVVVHGTAVPPARRGPQRAARHSGREYGLNPARWRGSSRPTCGARPGPAGTRPWSAAAARCSASASAGGLTARRPVAGSSASRSPAQGPSD
jgi:ADP-ribose pyrophosphatase YjhB (NUDIX family)